jgi:hypothetical protein
MPGGDQTRASVRRGTFKDRRVADGLAALDQVCSTGQACPAVQGSPTAAQALADLHGAVAAAHTSVAGRLSLASSSRRRSRSPTSTSRR